ncbi:hypothetical protein DPMN_167200 [Dreissena polymorpha]|uniref:Uncharacterized protein n=1 Tax=Dreissena polymorpha TaxID=45954 RepID=A0A9D4IYK2_DREPO|nr:hypothetical protein DPMN_167200 [Dreissena polymorpha]
MCVFHGLVTDTTLSPLFLFWVDSPLGRSRAVTDVSSHPRNFNVPSLGTSDPFVRTTALMTYSKTAASWPLRLA